VYQSNPFLPSFPMSSLSDEQKLALRTELKEIVKKIEEAERVLSRSFSQSNCAQMMDRRFARRDLERLKARYDEIREIALAIPASDE
jgi:hypothetical protein